MKTLYLVSAGVDDATPASVPLHIAVNGSAEVGHEVTVALVGDGTELLDAETASGLEGIGLPPVRELLAKLLEHRIPVHV